MRLGTEHCICSGIDSELWVTVGSTAVQRREATVQYVKDVFCITEQERSNNVKQKLYIRNYRVSGLPARKSCNNAFD